MTWRPTLLLFQLPLQKWGSPEHSYLYIAGVLVVWSGPQEVRFYFRIFYFLTNYTRTSYHYRYIFRHSLCFSRSDDDLPSIFTVLYLLLQCGSPALLRSLVRVVVLGGVVKWRKKIFELVGREGKNLMKKREGFEISHDHESEKRIKETFTDVCWCDVVLYGGCTVTLLENRKFTAFSVFSMVIFLVCTCLVVFFP